VCKIGSIESVVREKRKKYAYNTYEEGSGGGKGRREGRGGGEGRGEGGEDYDQLAHAWTTAHCCDWMLVDLCFFRV